MSSRIHKILGIPKAGYKSAVNLAKFQEKFRHQNHRITVLEEKLESRAAQAQAIEDHLPTVLNYITSFEHASREIARNNEELRDELEKLRERVELIRGELLKESRQTAAASGAEGGHRRETRGDGNEGG